MFTNFTSARRAGWRRLRAASSERQAVELTDIRSITTPPATFTRAQSDTQVSTALPGFLRLPPELRNVIYDLTLPDREYLSPLPPVLRSKTQSSLAEAYMYVYGLAPLCHSAVPPPLLQTCRTVRNEAYPMYFGRNVFVLDVNEFEDVEFGRPLNRPLNVCRVLKAFLRPTTATGYNYTMEWLRASNTHAICCMRNVLIVDRVACKRSHLCDTFHFAATVDLLPVEEAVQIQLRWHLPRVIMATDQVSRILEEFVQLKVTADMSEVRQKEELIATVRKDHYRAFRSHFLLWIIEELALQLTLLIVALLMLFGISFLIWHDGEQ
ncbi:hypothetical protein LTR56_014154 [Elasticomyces elasticus]|nr:hypothetical protein LTR56_014154 [Elasticomyces elasticus]KAK3662762.1 hypothetical protein LTR22_006378 [Elasticomyces elasticus]KAK4918014.1 hypothetical protein LTR49_014152 [Elasticomyces elasticus]KAK5754488.1 hypothetical protein LTS12_015443 [Elasticomyces elasticus]